MLKIVEKESEILKKARVIHEKYEAGAISGEKLTKEEEHMVWKLQDELVMEIMKMQRVKEGLNAMSTNQSSKVVL